MSDRRSQRLTMITQVVAVSNPETTAESLTQPPTTTAKTLREEGDFPEDTSPVPKKRAKLHKHRAAADDNAPCCCICLSEIARRELSGINCCSHEFCFGCIAEWSNTQNQCPLCKNRFQRISRVHPSRKCSTGLLNELRVPERNRLRPTPAVTANNNTGVSISFAFPFGTLDRDSLALAFHMFRQLAPTMGISQDAQERTIRRFEESHNNARAQREQQQQASR